MLLSDAFEFLASSAAKKTRVFFKMSRSSLSCLFSRRNRTISAFSAFLTLFPVFPGKAFAPSLCSSSRQRYKRTTGILRSRATWVTGFPDSFDKRTASNLNSRLYFLLVRRCMLDTPVLCILHSSQVSIFSGEVQFESFPIRKTFRAFKEIDPLVPLAAVPIGS